MFHALWYKIVDYNLQMFLQGKELLLSDVNKWTSVEASTETSVSCIFVVGV